LRVWHCARRQKTSIDPSNSTTDGISAPLFINKSLNSFSAILCTPAIKHGQIHLATWVVRFIQQLSPCKSVPTFGDRLLDNPYATSILLQMPFYCSSSYGALHMAYFSFRRLFVCWPFYMLDKTNKPGCQLDSPISRKLPSPIVEFVSLKHCAMVFDFNWNEIVVIASFS